MILSTKDQRGKIVTKPYYNFKSFTLEDLLDWINYGIGYYDVQSIDESQQALEELKHRIRVLTGSNLLTYSINNLSTDTDVVMEE